MGLRIDLDGKTVLAESKLGLVRGDADFSQGLRLVSESPLETVTDRYELPDSKRLRNTFQANCKTLHLERDKAGKIDVVFRVSNDGVAFRYVFPETEAGIHRIKEEVTSFRFLPGTRAWFQPTSQAKTGYEGRNPAYEEYYEMDLAVGTPSTMGAALYGTVLGSLLGGWPTDRFGRI